MPLTDPVSVLVVDDSALMRNLVSRMIESTPGLAVADKAMNGVFALQKIPRCNPDIIVLDIEMPGMNGIEFLKERRRLGIDIPVVILSSLARRGAEITMEALSLGASDFVTKPSGSVSSDIHTVAGELSRLLLVYGTRYKERKQELSPQVRSEIRERLSDAFPEEAHPVEERNPAEKIVPARETGRIELVAIGISTGGPNALRTVFSKLDKDLEPPVLVVQHMPAGFTDEFAKSLSRICPFEVKEAADGDLVRRGRILIAPGDRHIEVERKQLAPIVHVTEDPPENGHRPSADVLFRSVAREYGNHALGVIMTGMGRDGARELGSIYREGGYTLGQDEASSVVYGMPKVAHELGYVREQAGVDDMAAKIMDVVARHR